MFHNYVNDSTVNHPAALYIGIIHLSLEDPKPSRFNLSYFAISFTYFKTADENYDDEEDGGSQLRKYEGPHEMFEEDQDERDISDEDLDQDPSLAKEKGSFCFFSMPYCQYVSLILFFLIYMNFEMNLTRRCCQS